ncbi:protein of unknown function [Candidatus Nitrosocosmicus franklandus]|uniref:Uncharacterized protein n=1 Tax=Candidatus Nitrosocosmicus franklandianus TaxID=1798806 RepID=A0A484I601_9ARCH|nr:protein of unknown function [Candidatus Nitrosocosmicus franklandus]
MLILFIWIENHSDNLKVPQILIIEFAIFGQCVVTFYVCIEVMSQLGCKCSDNLVWKTT